MKPIEIHNEDIRNAICSGDSYILIGERKFLLLEVDQIKEPNHYEVTDTEEEIALLQALESDNPILSDDEIIKMLSK